MLNVKNLFQFFSLIVGATKCVFDASSGVAESSASFLIAAATLQSGNGEPVSLGIM